MCNKLRLMPFICKNAMTSLQFCKAAVHVAAGSRCKDGSFCHHRSRSRLYDAYLQASLCAKVGVQGLASLHAVGLRVEFGILQQMQEECADALAQAIHCIRVPAPAHCLMDDWIPQAWSLICAGNDGACTL